MPEVVIHKANKEAKWSEGASQTRAQPEIQALIRQRRVDFDLMRRLQEMTDTDSQFVTFL